MPQNDKVELRPCPFCGGPARIVKETRSDGMVTYKVGFAQCWKCAARSAILTTGGYYGLFATDEEISERWNRREENGNV